MSLFSKIRQKISKRRKPPQSKYVVPKSDYDLLKFIRIGVARGQNTIIDRVHDPETLYRNARILHNYYGMDSQELLIQTGFWVEERR